MTDRPYTLAMYRVRPGSESEFIRVWNELAYTFASLPHPPLWGTLIRSVTDRTLFYSFGPWATAADVQAMRESPAAAAFGKLHALCQEMTPGNYEVVTHVDVQGEGRA